jgi:hypothetical protein
MRADHAAPERDWPFLRPEDYGFFAAVKAK